MRNFVFVLTMCLLSVPAAATTFAEGTEPDPFAPGAECNAPKLMSSGSYVYDWPSKYDFVFAPFYDYIWSCKTSGYVSYADDFADLKDTEKPKIAEFLKSHPWRAEFDTDDGFQSLLDQMEAIYALRDQGRKERAYLLRARAFMYGADPKADAYRARALAIHKEILAIENPIGWQRIINLYVAGFYTWKLGDHAGAEPYFAEALSTKWEDEDGKEQTGSPYIAKLIEEIKAGKADDAVRFAAER